jgi:hypothetical protein
MVDLINVQRDGLSAAIPLTGNVPPAQLATDSLPTVTSVYSFCCPDAIGTYSKTIPAGQNYRIVRIDVVKTGAAVGGVGATVTVLKGAVAITPAIAATQLPGVLLANAGVAGAAADLFLTAGDTLNVTLAGLTDVSVRVDVTVIPV